MARTYTAPDWDAYQMDWHDPHRPLEPGGRASLEAVRTHVGEALAEPLANLGDECEFSGHHGFESGAGGVWSIGHDRCHRAHAGHLVQLVAQERGVEIGGFS